MESKLSEEIGFENLTLGPEPEHPRIQKFARKLLASGLVDPKFLLQLLAGVKSYSTS